MKVVYNTCHGGFGLSPLALTEFSKRKGDTIFWYEQVNREYDTPDRYVRLDTIPEASDSLYVVALSANCGKEFEEFTFKEPRHTYRTYKNDEKSFRTDLDLVAVVEELGDKANDRFSELDIAEIPDGAVYEIDEYDGYESVVPPRMTWEQAMEMNSETPESTASTPRA